MGVSFSVESAGPRQAAIDLEHELSEGFAARYIGHKARQLVGVAGFSRSDLTDLRQEFGLALLARLSKFNPRRGHWNAFVVTVIDRQVATLLAARRAQKRWRVVLQLDAATCAVPSREEDRQIEVDLEHDVKLIVGRLPRRLRIVWDWMAHGPRLTADDLFAAQQVRTHRSARGTWKFLPKISGIVG